MWEAANRRFHLAITAPCGMSRLMASIGDLHRSDARFLFATWKQLDWQPRSDTEHWAILDAIERGDSKSARELLSQSGLAQISTLWHTTRPNTGFEWDHTLTGSEVFVPIE